MPKMPIHPKHPERICWGCEKYCSANHLCCRETRAAHPVELFGDDWWEASNSQPVSPQPDKRREPRKPRSRVQP